MRRKVKTFFDIFADSLLPQPREYRSFIHRNLIFSFKYFAFYICILSCVVFVHYFFYYQPLTFLFDVSKSLNSYPEDLVITIQKGTVTKNYDRPYFMWLDHQNKKKLLFLMEEKDSSKKLLNEYKPVFYLTKNMLTYQVNPQSGIYTLTDKQSFLIDKKMVQNLAQKISLLLGIGLFPFLLFFLIYIILCISVPTILIIISVTFIFYVVLNYLKHHHTFHKIVQVAIHSSTLPLLITTTLIIVQGKISFPLFFFFILFILSMSTGIYEGIIYKQTRQSLMKKHV